MANYGMLRNYRFTDDKEDIRGAKLFGLNDEKLGKIDDVIFDHNSGWIRYVVVDTGGWLSTKKFIIGSSGICRFGRCGLARSGRVRREH